MLVNRKSIICYLIFQTTICISNALPTDAKNAYPEEVDESDIEKVIAKKEQEEKVKKLEEITLEHKLEEEKANNGILNKNKKPNEDEKYDEKIQQKIKKLEKKKGDLYKQIHQAINESIVLLEHTNNTEAKSGINFMENLKQQLKELNGTDMKLEHGEKSIQRRSHANDPAARKTKTKVKLYFNEIADIFKVDSKEVSGNRTRGNDKKLHENDLEVNERINDWIRQKQLEKEKILQYKWKLKQATQKEKCPKYGEDKKKISVNGIRRGKYRPCCRKCCKKSYMGCL